MKTRLGWFATFALGLVALAAMPKTTTAQVTCWYCFTGAINGIPFAVCDEVGANNGYTFCQEPFFGSDESCNFGPSNRCEGYCPNPLGCNLLEVSVDGAALRSFTRPDFGANSAEDVSIREACPYESHPLSMTTAQQERARAESEALSL